MASLDQQPVKIYRGTIEEVFSHRSEIPPGTTVELKVFEPIMVADEDTNASEGKSLAERSEKIGTAKGLPADLASYPSSMQGIGAESRKTNKRQKPTAQPEAAAKPKQLRGRGMLAGILSSEDVMRRKQEEIDLEDRPRR